MTAKADPGQRLKARLFAALLPDCLVWAWRLPSLLQIVPSALSHRAQLFPPLNRADQVSGSSDAATIALQNVSCHGGSEPLQI